MIIKNRNLFRLTRFILLELPKLLKLRARYRKPEKRLLIIKTDAIGDYVLFRNFIEITKRSETFKDYRIDLLGNTLWQDIALQYDSQYINDFFFIRADELYEAPLKTLKLGCKLFKNNYEMVLQPAYSRTLIADGLAALTAAKKIIGFESDTERISARYKAKTDFFYTQRLRLHPNIHFEFDRYRFFFESILGETISLQGPHIGEKKEHRQGVVIFPGAGVFKRSWEAEKFLALIRLILQHSSQTVYIVGSQAESKTGNYLMENLRHQGVNNLIGKTSLVQLIEIIGNATLLIANETSAIHIGAATQTQSVCILGGGHFGRFTPYSEFIESKPLCVYEKMDCYNCNWNCIFKTKEDEPYPCISNISLLSVWQVVLPLLS